MNGVTTDMRYMREDLKQEYERYHEMNPDIAELAAPLMNVSDVLRAYFILIDYFSDETANVEGETMLVGIRDMGLLASALGRQVVSFNGIAKYREPLDICATLFYGLTKNHALADGNKRTALLILLYQLYCYGYRPTAGQKEFEKLVLAVASNQLETSYPKMWGRSRGQDEPDRCVQTISRQLKCMVARKNNAFHINIMVREFAAKISAIPGCSCETDGNKLKLQRVITHRRWFAKPVIETKKWTVTYIGDTRTIGAATVREALEKLELYDQFADYQSFMEGAEPCYSLIQSVEGPLRRLKDK